MLRVLHFVPRVCWPLDTGAKLRNYHLARVLAERADITLLAFSENDEQKAESSNSHPQHFYQRMILVRRDQGYTFSKIVRGAVGSTPLPVLNYTTNAMKQQLARILDKDDFDIVQIESIHLAAYLPIIRAAKNRPLVICDWHNVESELMWRYSERETNLLRRAYAQKTSRQMSRLERRALDEFDAHIVVSRRDGERLLEQNPDARLFVIENGVDTSSYMDAQLEEAHAAWLARPDNSPTNSSMPRNESSSERAKRRIAFVGSMDYHANVDGVVNFAEEIWPLLRQQMPDLIFTIVGRDPAPEVLELAAMQGIEVTGTVADVRPYYYEMLAAIIPLRVGGGSRLKILEAMAAGVPVISTTLGAEGLDVEDGRNIIIAETGDEFCRAVTSIAQDDEQRRKLIEAGRALVHERYDWSRLGTMLFESYKSLLDDEQVNRVEVKL